MSWPPVRQATRLASLGMRRILLSVAAGLAVTLLTAPTTISAGPAAADPGPGAGQGVEASAAPIRVIQHNTDHVPEAWQFAVQQIEEHQPELASIQEVCRPWFDALRLEQLPGRVSIHHEAVDHRAPYRAARVPSARGARTGKQQRTRGHET